MIEQKELIKLVKEEYKVNIGCLKGLCVVSFIAFFTLMYFISTLGRELSSLEFIYFFCYMLFIGGVYGFCAIILVSDEESSKPDWFTKGEEFND